MCVVPTGSCNSWPRMRLAMVVSDLTQFSADLCYSVPIYSNKNIFRPMKYLSDL